MESLSTKLVWIDGSCYRVNPNNFENMASNQQQENEQAPYIEEDVEDGEDDDIEFTETQNGKIRVSLPIPQIFHGIIIGAKGSTRQRLESETKANIDVPNRMKGGDVIITGRDRKSVISAVRRINMMILAKRQTMRPTHFISVPINSEEVVKNYVAFKNEVMQNFMSNDILEEYFTTETKLHLTLCVLLLADNEERSKAVKLLQEAHDNIIKPLLNGKQLELNLKGLAYMNDDPANVQVLYVEVEEDELFRKMINQINEHFIKSGLTTRQRTDIKLHMTVLNTKTDDSWKRTSFNATNIMEKFKNFEFGKSKVTTMHVSVMNSTTDGYYTSTGSINL